MKLLVCLSVVLCYSSAALGQACTGSGYAKDPATCTGYLECFQGSYIKRPCGAGLNWNQAASACDWPANAPCQTGGVPPKATTQSTVPNPKPTTQSTVPKPQPGGKALITEAEFKKAAATKGGNPDSSYYQGFINSLAKADITTRQEAILFLAHATWETVGFIYTKEVYCQTNMAGCLAAYPNQQGGLPGKVYYGRGMLQLTWDYNYKAASQYLYGDDRLIQNPDVVGTDPAVGWATAAYFWHANVHRASMTFGTTLKAINGALECDGGSHGQNRYLRFMHYKDIVSQLGEATPSDDYGWCTAW